MPHLDIATGRKPELSFSARAAALVLWLIIFKPTPVLLLGYFGAKIGDMLIVFTAIAAIVLTIRKLRTPISRYPVTLVILVSLLGLEIQGALYGSTSWLPTTVLDSVQFVNWVNFIILYLFGCTVAPFFGAQLLKKLLPIVIVFSVFSWVLFFNLGNIKSVASLMFELGKSRGIENSASHLGLFRLASTFGNPNYFGLFCAYLAALGVYLSLIAQGNLGKWIAFTTSAVLLTLLSGSRTAAAAFIIAGSCAALFAGFDLAQKKKFSRLLILTAVVTPFAFYFGASFIVSNIEKLERYTDIQNMSESWNARALVWENLSDLNTSAYTILFGVGSHEIHTGNLDSQYVATLYRMGIFGLLCLACLLVWSIYIGGKLRKRSYGTLDNGLGASMQILALVLIVGSTTAQSFSHFQTAAFFLLQLAVVENRVFQRVRAKGIR